MGGDGMAEARVELPDSHRAPVPGAQRVADANPAEQVSVTLVLRRRSGAPTAATPAEEFPSNSVDARRRRRQDFAQAQGADPADVALVEAFAAAQGLTVHATDLARRSVVLAGTV